MEDGWRQAKTQGEAVLTQTGGARYKAAVAAVRERGFVYLNAEAIEGQELIARMRALVDPAAGPHDTNLDGPLKLQAKVAPEAVPAPIETHKALLGLICEPKLSLQDGFERFWAHIQDEWMRLSVDQQRVKRNVYLKSIRNFEQAVGSIGLYEVRREHALKFRAWYLGRVQSEGLKPYTGNREINSLRRMLAVNFDIDAKDQPNPFARVRLKDEGQSSRIPFSTNFLQTQFVKPGALEGLPAALRTLTRLLINTGLRPSEAIGLETQDIYLTDPVPHVHVRANGVRSLKTAHSDRKIPLLGVSLEAARELISHGGRWPDEEGKYCAEAAAASPWGRWAGKNMYATTLINRRFRESGLVMDKAQSLYSLRHWFQDQLTRLNVVDRAQAQLMGHKFHRPKYGHGKDLEALQEIIGQFAIEAVSSE